MTDTENIQTITDAQNAERTVTPEILKERLDAQSAVSHGEGCDCPGTSGASVDEMLAIMNKHGAPHAGSAPWTEQQAAEILSWWTQPVDAQTEYSPEDVENIVASILSQDGATPAEQRTGISDRKAAVLDGLAMVRGNLRPFAQAAGTLYVLAQQNRNGGNLLTVALEQVAREEFDSMADALTKSLNMLTAVVKSMD